MGKLEKKQYRVEGIFWVPGYNDFDFDDFEVNAYSKKQALKKAQMNPMWNLAKKPPAISRVCNTDITQLELILKR
tara:strand:+ start:219 stop:443 length:225 start_codon:yes stop_codon:yes gene_type:complete